MSLHPTARGQNWSQGLGRNHAERRGLERQIPSWKPVFGDRRPPGWARVPGCCHPFRTPRGLEVKSRARRGHLAGGGWGQPLPVPAQVTAQPLLPHVLNQKSCTAVAPGAQHRHDTGALPAQGSSQPRALLAEGGGTLWQKQPMELQQNRYRGRWQESFSITCTSLTSLSDLQYWKDSL